MAVQKTILWAVVALLIGAGLGFGFREPIANVLNLKALEVSQGDVPDFKNICPPPKIPTGNGCADPRGWTINDWLFFANCLENAMRNPPPPLPDHAITQDERNSCARQTEGG